MKKNVKVGLFGVGLLMSTLAISSLFGNVNEPPMVSKAFAEGVSNAIVESTEIANKLTENTSTTEETVDNDSNLSDWDKKRMAEYYRELYGPKVRKTVTVDGYEFDYINGAPCSVYNEMARQAKAEEERIAREEELARQMEAERQAEIEASYVEPVVETVEAPTNENGYTYYGACTLTAYMETGNPCADGVYPQVGYTCACNDPSLWHKWIYIEGYGTYYVHDTGGMPSYNIIDIYLGTYDACIQFGCQSANVYIVN